MCVTPRDVTAPRDVTKPRDLAARCTCLCVFASVIHVAAPQNDAEYHGQEPQDSRLPQQAVQSLLLLFLLLRAKRDETWQNSELIRSWEQPF